MGGAILLFILPLCLVYLWRVSCLLGGPSRPGRLGLLALCLGAGINLVWVLLAVRLPVGLLWGNGVVFLLVLAELWGMLRLKPLPLLFGGAYCLLNVALPYYLSLSVHALVRGEPLQWVIGESGAYPWLCCVSMALALLLTVTLHTRILGKEKLRQLFQSPVHLATAAGGQLVLGALLLAVFSGTRAVDQPWDITVFLCLTLVCILLHGMLLGYGVNAARLKAQREYSGLLEEQLQSQLAHYRELQGRVEEVRQFRHDCASLLTAVHTLSDLSEEHLARELLDEMQDSLRQHTAPVWERYSNNPLLDAVLQSTARQCREEGIAFSASAPMPGNLSLENMALCRVFSNLLRNALEACQRLEEGRERFLRLSTQVNEGWVYVKIDNSYGGTLHTAGGRLATSKEDPGAHGLGLGIVQRLVAESGGFVHYQPQPDKGVFTANLHLSRENGALREVGKGGRPTRHKPRQEGTRKVG